MADPTESEQPKNPELIRLLQSESQIRPASNLESLEDSSIECEWTKEETSCLFKLIEEYEYIKQIKSKNEQVYTKLSKLMTVSGHKKSNEEIKYFWEELQEKYVDYKVGKIENFEYCQQMNGLDLDNVNSSSRSEPEVIVKIKGEELENNNSSIIITEVALSSDESEGQKNGRCGRRRNNWTQKETECVVEVLEKYGMPSRTNLRKFCYVIVDYLKQHGFVRSEEQTQVKIKHLRALYNQVVRKCIKEEEFPFFKRIEVLMQTYREQKAKESEETQNYIILDEQEQSKSGGEENDHCVEDDSSYNKKSRQIWTNKEIRVLLSFIEENGIVTGKQLRKVCNKAVDYLASYGYYRSPTQIVIRWKNTKALYWATFRKKSKSPEKECCYFYRLHSILNPDDSTYDGRNCEDVVDDDVESNFYQTIPNNVDIKANLFNFNELNNQASFNFSSGRENFITLQTNSNSNNDGFVTVQNLSNCKRYQIADVSIDPLQNGDSDEKVMPTSPKRSKIEPDNVHVTTACSNCTSLDSVDHYCISLAHSIKKLDSRKQAKLKIQIQQLMYKAEFDSDF